MKWWIGCSGFHYNHWKNVFYPGDLPKSKWFDYYKERFNTLELNVTFYRFPRLNVLETWYKKSPKKFSFSVKVPRAITHYKQFHETERMLSDCYGTIREGLQDKLGAVLFQLPGRSAYTEERLQRIVDSLDPGFNNVLEFRHPSWWNEGVYRTLGKHKISFCGMSHPALPDEVILNSPIVYYRFHGTPELYKSPYDTAFLEKVSREISGNKKAKQAFLYFNNDIDGSAIKNARELHQIVTGQLAIK
jgi:uncharacterized protein YecE (DUF72 family)